MGQTREQRKAKEAARAAHQAMMDAGQDEIRRFNEAVAKLPWGQKPILTTFAGEYEVASVNGEWWILSYPVGATRHDQYTQRSWAGCNNGTWADWLRQLGVPRNARYAPRA